MPRERRRSLPWRIARLLGVTLITVVAIGVLWLARAMGMLSNGLALVLLIGPPIVAVVRLVQGLRGRISLAPLRAPRAPRAHARYFAVTGLHAVTWLVAVVAIDTALVPAQFEPQELAQFSALMWGMALAWIVLDAIREPASRCGRTGWSSRC